MDVIKSFLFSIAEDNWKKGKKISAVLIIIVLAIGSVFIFGKKKNSESTVNITKNVIEGDVYITDKEAAEDVKKAIEITTAYTMSQPEPCDKKGEILSPSGGLLNGYDYVAVENGSFDVLVRDNLTDGWHITAVQYYIRNGKTWYNLYDTDDGDHYGWLDEGHIRFY